MENLKRLREYLEATIKDKKREAQTLEGEIAALQSTLAFARQLKEVSE